MVPQYLYLHGFLSSPASLKAQQTLKYVEAQLPHIEIWVPQLPNKPEATFSLLDRLIAKQQPLRIIGSSMGGFLATYVLSQCPGRAVLINPAVDPHLLMHDYQGEHINPYTQETFSIDAQDVAILEQRNPQVKRPTDFWCLLQQEDETLDYRLAENKYSEATLTIEAGGDHSFQGYERYLPAIFDFLAD